jgi:hypothetical protein
MTQAVRIVLLTLTYWVSSTGCHLTLQNNVVCQQRKVPTLTHGTAEIFGAELPKGSPAELPGGKYAIYTWSGATVEITGRVVALTPRGCQIHYMEHTGCQ